MSQRLHVPGNGLYLFHKMTTNNSRALLRDTQCYSKALFLPSYSEGKVQNKQLKITPPNHPKNCLYGDLHW